MFFSNGINHWLWQCLAPQRYVLIHSHSDRHLSDLLPPCSSTFTDAPLPLSLVWGAKRNWRNAPPTIWKMRNRKKANPQEKSGKAAKGKKPTLQKVESLTMTTRLPGNWHSTTIHICLYSSEERLSKTDILKVGRQTGLTLSKRYLYLMIQ